MVTRIRRHSWLDNKMTLILKLKFGVKLDRIVVRITETFSFRMNIDLSSMSEFEMCDRIQELIPRINDMVSDK